MHLLYLLNQAKKSGQHPGDSEIVVLSEMTDGIWDIRFSSHLCVSSGKVLNQCEKERELTNSSLNPLTLAVDELLTFQWRGLGFLSQDFEACKKKKT